MTFHYPNGIPYNHHEAQSPKKQVKKKRPVEFGNRGMDFEEAPVQIVKVDYPKRSAAVIKEAYFRQASTTDYNGVYQGRYIDFEAKETKNTTSFPFKNFHQHQIDHMEQCIAQQGICFVLLWFSSLKRCFFFSGENLITHWKTKQLLEKNLCRLHSSRKKELNYLLESHRESLISTQWNNIFRHTRFIKF